MTNTDNDPPTTNVESDADLLSEFGQITADTPDDTQRLVLELVGGDTREIIAALTKHTDVIEINHVKSNDIAKENLNDDS